ncbi:MAG: PAS domain-containing protein [candidate division WOR-3 bacterium]
MELKFFDQLDIGITVCDREGTIIYMNEKAKKIFQDYGENLIGKSVFDCHPEPARSKLQEMMSKQEKNVYTIEKKGIKKLIYQSPFYIDGEYSGFYELSLEIPFEMKNFKRDKE